MFFQGGCVNSGSAVCAAAGDQHAYVNAYCWPISVVENIYSGSDENVKVKGYIASPALGRTSKQEA